MQFDLAAANEEAKRRLEPALQGHGAHLSFDDAIRGFPADLRNTAPQHVPYTFWHQLEHMRIGQWDILRYIVDPSHTSPGWPDEYWPPRDAQATDDSWGATIEGFRSDRDELLGLLRDPEVNVLEPVEHMDGRSVMREVLLVVDHTGYHLGEFVMGRQILGMWESELA